MAGVRPGEAGWPGPRVALAGSSEAAAAVLDRLHGSPVFDLCAALTLAHGPVARAARRLRLPLVHQPQDWSALAGHPPDLVVVADLAYPPGCLDALPPPGPAVLTEPGEPVLGWLQELITANQRYERILNSVHEAVQLVDRDGVIRYINPAFSRITGLAPAERLGASVFDVSPDGSLVKVLRTGRAVTGVRNKAKGSAAEVVSNAAPIFLGGEMVGAVAVFQDMSDLVRLSRHLQESSKMIATLNRRLQQLQSAQYTFADIIGNSPRMREAVAVARRAAAGSSTVLILGESGTGKELFAHAIHQASRRAGGPFVVVNCAAIPENLLESEFFGHEKGAFTSALKTKVGRFELADGGTIFLDEIGDLDPALQAKLLRVLQYQEFTRVGGEQPIRVDVRIIAATNRDLQRRIADGLFREDLFHRLNVVPLHIPPLRARREDIPDLAAVVLARLSHKMGAAVRRISPETMALIQDHHWPGNVRELENVLERALNEAEGETLPHAPVARHILQARPRGAPAPAEAPRVVPLAQLEKQALEQALAFYGTSTRAKQAAADALGISLSTLYAKTKAYGIKAGE